MVWMLSAKHRKVWIHYGYIFGRDANTQAKFSAKTPKLVHGRRAPAVFQEIKPIRLFVGFLPKTSGGRPLRKVAVSLSWKLGPSPWSTTVEWLQLLLQPGLGLLVLLLSSASDWEEQPAFGELWPDDKGGRGELAPPEIGTLVSSLLKIGSEQD